MTGKEAAQAVKALCLSKRHQLSPVNSKDAILCTHCREIMAHLERLGEQEHKPLSLASLFIVVNPDGTVRFTTLDGDKAEKAAEECRGLVVSWPVSSDYRPEKDR